MQPVAPVQQPPAVIPVFPPAGTPPVFADAAAQLIPDPAVYSDWFAGATERERKTAVGSRRYNWARGELGRSPQWPDFLDPDTGDLVPLPQLRAETAAERVLRAGRAVALLSERGLLARLAALLGFLPAG